MKSIIYVPGIGHGFLKEDSIENYAYRYLKAIDSTEKSIEKKYSISSSKIKYGSNNQYSSDGATIIEINEDGTSKEVCRIFQLDYANLLTKFYDKKNIIIKLVYTVYFLIANIFTFSKINQSNKKINYFYQNMQYLYMISIFFIICLGGMLMIPSLFIIGVETFKKAKEVLLSIPNSSYQHQYVNYFNFYNAFEILSKFCLATIAFVSVFIPKFQEFITEFSNRLIGMSNYLRLGDEKLNIIGKFETLIESILELDKNTMIEIHGYSLGSIIVLDAFFPYGHEPSPRIKENVDTIVTIGCMYDFIAKIFPKYFKNRKSYKLNVTKWYNIYSKLDIISSNFSHNRNSSHSSYGIVENGLKPSNIEFEVLNAGSLNFLDYLFLIGLKAHTMYWGTDIDSISCLKDLVIEQKK